MKQYTPAQLQRIYLISRNVQWRYRLDQYEDKALKSILGTLKRSMGEIEARVAATKPLTDFQADRMEAMLVEFDGLTAATRAQLGSDIADVAAHAGEWAVAEHSSITSFGGLVADFNNIALSAEQFRQFMVATPMGGKTLAGWVDAAFDSTVKANLRESLNAGVLQGEGFRKLAKRALQESAGMLQREAITLARTYVQSANVAAQQAVYAANADVVKQWEWCATLEPGYMDTGRGTCVRCAALDGQKFELGKGPDCPLHPRCLTPETPVFAPDKIAATVATYRGPVFEIGLANGARFTVTPNHLLLTPDGFVPAQSLGQGAKVFYNAMAEGVVSGDPDDNRKPTTIEQVVKAMAEATGMSTVRVPASPEYLHGDGRFMDGDINIVAPDSLLRGDVESFFSEHFGEGCFEQTDMGLIPLSAQRDLLQPLLWLRNATGSGVGGLSVSDVLLGGTPGHHQAVGRQSVPDGYPRFFEASADDIARYAKAIGKSIFGFACDIGRDDLFNGEIDSCGRNDGRLSVDRFDPVAFQHSGDSIGMDSELLSQFAGCFSEQISFADVYFCRERYFCGHVYDLQTFSTLYYVNGVVSSNCRCVALPVTKTWRELGIDADEMEDVARPYTMRPDKNIDAGGSRTIIENGFHDGDYGSWFKNQSGVFQDNAVGPKRAAMLRAGKVGFHDLVDETGRLRTLDELGWKG